MKLTKRQWLMAAASPLALGTGWASQKMGREMSGEGRREDGSVRTWRTYARNRYGQLHLHVAEPVSGVAKRPLVCFHTSPLSGVEFESTQHELARDRRVICPDNPGFGSSDRPASPPEIADYAGALLEGLENSGLLDRNMPFDVLGNHTGTVICTELATANEVRVHKVVLSGIPLYAPAERAAMRARLAQPKPFFTDPDYVPGTFRDSVFKPSDLPGDRRLELFAEGLRAGSLSWWAARAVYTYDLPTRLAQIAQPVLFLLVQDILAANTREASQVPSHATVIDLIDRTKYPAWDLQPELVALELRRFLDA